MVRLKLFVRLLINNFTLRPSSIFFLARHSLTLLLLNFETEKQFANNYGNFNRDRDLRGHRVPNPGSEGGALIGDIIFLAKSVELGSRNLLLAGDRLDVKKIWHPIFPQSQIYTCGIHEMDEYWNFDEPIPDSLKTKQFGLIVSHAMIEHLFDPVQHVRDLISLLEPGGNLILHSVLPGFFYHRVPIDCYRFYPDFFESVSSRLGLSVVEKQISAFNITYKYRRMA